MLKYIDKFLAFLKTDRNTFATYILTLGSIYVVVDRIVEMALMAFTGVSVSYWGPIEYTVALACPVFAFFFSGPSKFTKGGKLKLTFFYIYCIALYIVGISMFTQWINMGAWLAFTYVPNYSYIVTEFSELIKPAFTSISLYLPLMTFFWLFKILYMGVNDILLMKDSIMDYPGLDLSDTSVGIGPYTCEVMLCTEGDTGKPVNIPEVKRYESTLIVGSSGTGKTTMVFEPMIAKDLEKKHFFREAAKELGYTALKTGIASLNSPYDNEYMNKNFSLNMIKPNPSKEGLYKKYLSKLIHDYSSIDNIVYKNLGITYISPDYESMKKMADVAKNFNLKVNIIDPMDAESSIGINPFVHKSPLKVAIIISSVLKGLYSSSHIDIDDAYRDNTVVQATENLALLLKEVYPRLHEGMLPNLEDLQKLLNDFDLVEEMCQELEKYEDLREKYSVQLSYFKKNFYKGSARKTRKRKIFTWCYITVR